MQHFVVCFCFCPHLILVTASNAHIQPLTYKQVEHNVSYDDIEGAEVNERSSIVATVCLPVSMFVGGAEGGLDLLTKKRKRGFQKSTTMHFCLNIYCISENCDNSSSSHHTVMHDFIPIFPCDNAEENSDGFSCCGEVGMSVIGGHKQMCQFLPKHPLHDWTFCISDRKCHTQPVYVLSIFDRSKENNSSESIAEEEEEHAHDDEEALVHAHNNSQQQHLQCHLHKCQEKQRFCVKNIQSSHRRDTVQTYMFATYCKEPEDDHTCAHHVGVCILQEVDMELNMFTHTHTFHEQKKRFSNQQGKMQNYPDDAKRCDQQVITISSTLPVTRRGHGYQLHCHLGNNMST